MCSQKLSLTAWEPYVQSRAHSCTELPAALEPIFEQPAHLCMASVCAVSDGSIESVGRRKGCIWRSIPASKWNQYCMIVLFIVWGGRAVPLLWRGKRTQECQCQQGANMLPCCGKLGGCCAASRM